MASSLHQFFSCRQIRRGSYILQQDHPCWNPPPFCPEVAFVQLSLSSSVQNKQLCMLTFRLKEFYHYRQRCVPPVLPLTVLSTYSEGGRLVFWQSHSNLLLRVGSSIHNSDLLRGQKTKLSLKWDHTILCLDIHGESSLLQAAWRMSKWVLRCSTALHASPGQ